MIKAFKAALLDIKNDISYAKYLELEDKLSDLDSLFSRLMKSFKYEKDKVNASLREAYLNNNEFKIAVYNELIDYLDEFDAQLIEFLHE